MTVDDPPSRFSSDDLEQAVRAYETALLNAGLGRHAQPDHDGDDDLLQPRIEVVRLAEAVSSASWPRPRCDRCHGHREVDAVTATYPEHGTAKPTTPQVMTVRRWCPQCMGTGMTLDLDPASAPGGH